MSIITDEYASIDTSGLRCPLPLLKLKKYLKTLATPQTICFITTDAITMNDLDDFCHLLGCKLQQTTGPDETGAYVCLIITPSQNPNSPQQEKLISSVSDGSI